MSEELKMLERRASARRITDSTHIDKVVRYMLSLPFSHFQKDARRYRFLRNDLCNGFHIEPDALDRLSLEDLLMLIGYEPGNPFFDPPDGENRQYGRQFNAAGHSYVLALLLRSLAKTDVRIKEFTHIGLAAYTDYLRKTVEGEYRNRLLPSSARSSILCGVEAFRRRTCAYVRGVIAEAQIESISEEITLGDLMSKALSRCERSWLCPFRALDEYADEIVESYRLLNRLFMDAVRMPLVRSDRARFLEIITGCRDRTFNEPARIDYEACYEPGVPAPEA